MKPLMHEKLSAQQNSIGSTITSTGFRVKASIHISFNYEPNGLFPLNKQVNHFFTECVPFLCINWILATFFPHPEDAETGLRESILNQIIDACKKAFCEWLFTYMFFFTIWIYYMPFLK